ncbi:MAG TPA: hypothetical protein VG893_09900 [Terracidiphilus sp.]|nr:hypothetical protein [Terracidiphilus sp.]
MPRRRTKGQNALIGIIVILGIIVLGISRLVESIGIGTFVLIIATGIFLMIWIKHSRRQARIQQLQDKYGDPHVVDLILHRHFWQGQTAEQLADSLGTPQGVDRKCLSTRNREIWKYNHRGANRYGLRITLDDGIVSTWDQKQ